MNKQEAGMTMIELLMAATVIGILALVVSTFYSNRLIESSREFSKTILQANTKQAVETMERDLKFAQYIEANNRWPDNNAPSAPGNLYSWQSTTSTPATLVIAVPSRDASGNIIYFDALHNTVQTDDIVYYIDSQKILYRRTIANPVAGNKAVTTCPPALATSTCPADAKVVEDVASLQVVYYDGTNNSTLTPANAGSLAITLQQSRTKFKQTYTSSLTSRVTMRNQ
jgi:prepilin-type N-terminal cleavage/methylation domain-containing protein